MLHDVATGAVTPVRARYLIAADGSRSGVRRSLGIDMNGPDDLGRQRGVYFRADLSARTGPHPRGLYFMTDVGGVLIWTHPDDRWVVNVPDRDDDPLRLIERAVGAMPGAVEVLGDTGWTAAAQSATRFRHGPVFLVGDAAYRFPPAGATGVSTAMHDAHNLAWKLSAVLSGQAGADLLDSYDMERRPVAERNVTETANEWRRFVDPAATLPAGRDIRQIDMGYQYRSQAVVPDGSLWRSALSDTPVVSQVLSGEEWRAPFGVEKDGVVLVRPDGIVAWRSRSADDPANLRSALCQVLSDSGDLEDCAGV